MSGYYLFKSKSLHEKIFIIIFLTLAMYLVIPINLDSIGAILLFATGLTFSFYKPKKQQFKIIITLSLFYLIEVVTLLYSEDLNTGLKVITKGLTFVLMPASFVLLKNKLTNKLIYVFLSFYLLSLIILGFLLMFFLIDFFEIYSFKILTLVFENWNFKHSLLSGFYTELHPTYFSMALFLGILILLERLKVTKFNLYKFTYFIIISFYIFLILILRSRIVLLSSIIILPVYICLIFNLVNVKNIIISVFSLAIFLCLILVNQKAGINDILSVFKVNQSQVSRIDIYSASYQVIKENMFLGVGVGDVKNELISVYKSRNLDNLYLNNFFNSHNQYLNFLLSGGIILLFSFLWTVTFLVRKSLIFKDYLFLSFILLIVIIMLTENILNRINGIFFFSFFTCIFYFRNITKQAINEE